MKDLQQDERFAAALEECCRRVRSGEALERCLTDYPADYREELTRLVPLAGRLAVLARDPSPQFQARLEQRLLASVDQARQARGAGRLGSFRRFFSTASALRVAAAVLAAALVLVGSGVGAIQASAGSLPDSPLYRVKTAQEWVQLAIARDGESRVGVHAEQITQRGREFERAVLTGKPRRVVEVLTLRLAQSVDQMVDQVLELQARGKPQAVPRALTAIRAMERHLERLTAQAEPEVRPLLTRMKDFLEAQERRLLERNVRSR